MVILDGVKRKFRCVEMSACSCRLIWSEAALSKMACTMAADCTLGGSQGKATPFIGVGSVKLGSMNMGAKRSSDCIWTSLNGLLRKRRRFSSSKRDQSMGSSSNGSEKVLPFSLPLPKMSRMFELFEVLLVLSLKLKIFLRSCEEGNLKHSMKLAVPEFKRNLIEPLSDEGVFSCPSLGAEFHISHPRFPSSTSEVEHTVSSHWDPF